jgi:hypothetical protein
MTGYRGVAPGMAARPRRAWTWAALVAGAVAAAGCGGGGGGSEPVANPRDPVRVMLRERAEALNAGDLERWLAPVAPEARQFEELVGRGALSMPLARVDLTLGTADVEPGGARFERAEVALVYRYEGLPDDNVFRLYLRSDIALRDGKWVITATEPNPDAPSEPPIWATGTTETARSPHFLALFRPGLPGVQDLLDKAERSRERLLPRLTLEPDDQHLVVFARDQAEYESLGGVEGSLAFVSSVYRTPSGAYLERPENREMYVNVVAVSDPVRAEEVRDRPDALHGVVFEHELGHLALSRFDRMPTPVWLSEAGAMQLAEERRVDDWKRIVEGDLFDELELSFGPMSRAESIGGAQYAYANAGVSYLVEAFGIEKFWDFYQNFKALGATMTDVPAMRGEGAQRLVRRYYGFDLDELDTRTRDYMRKAVAAG